MMDKDMFGKLQSEQPLTAEESLRLDELLESERGTAVKEAVAALKDDEPSLAWRSVLNQRLGKVSRQRRLRPVWRFGFAATAAAAASLFVVSLIQPGVTVDDARPGLSAEKEPTLEDAILGEHQDAMQQASLGIHASYSDAGS